MDNLCGPTMLILDTRTLIVAIGLIAISSAITLAFLWKEHIQRSGVGYWSFGMAMIGFSSLLTALYGIVYHGISIVFANFLLVLGFQLIFRGLRSFTGRLPIKWFDYGLVILSAGVFFYFSYIYDNQLIRTCALSVFIIAICVATIITIVTDKNKIQKRAGIAVAIVFGLFAFLHFMRAVFALLFPDNYSVVENNLSTTLLYTSVLFFIGAIAVTLVAQTYAILASRLRTISMAMEQSASSILITDDGGHIEYANPSALQVSGYTREEIKGKKFSSLCAGNFDQESISNVVAQLKYGSSWRGELHNYKKSGEEYWEIASIAPVKNSSGQISHFVAVKEDITSIKQAKDKIHHLAQHDNLTGLPNRLLMMERLERAITTATDNGCQVAILFIDVDGFKEVNDQFGHATGDLLLKKLTQDLTACVRDTDTVARIGGDEFIVVLENVTDDQALRMVAQRMIKTVSEPFNVQDSAALVTASIGISVYPKDSQDPTELIQLADKAMYKIKHNGKNNFAFASGC